MNLLKALSPKTIAFQLAPNVIVIGSQTAGADGNITYIDFPGEFRASLSGLGVYYPMAAKPSELVLYLI